MSNLVYCLLQSLCYAMCILAGTRTQQRFVDRLWKGIDGGVPATLPASHDEGDYPADMLRVVRTFVNVLSKRSASAPMKIGVNVYSPSQYVFPAQWWELAKAARVYTSDEAMLHGIPLCEVSAIGGEMMDPDGVRMFFNKYNSNQAGDEYRFELVGCPATFGDPAFWHSLEAFSDGARLYVNNGGSGTISDHVSQILQIGAVIVNAFPDGFADNPVYSEEAISRWLLKLE